MRMTAIHSVNGTKPGGQVGPPRPKTPPPGQNAADLPPDPRNASPARDRNRRQG